MMRSLHPEWTSFLEEHPDISHDDPLRNEAFLSDPANHDLVSKVCVTNGTVPARDNHRIGIRQYTAEATRTPEAIVVFFHSGAFVVGSLETEDIFCRYMALAGPVTVVSVEYRLCPEHKFPVPMNDAWDATEYIMTNISELALEPLRPVRLVISGTSSGGQLAAIVSQRTRDWLKATGDGKTRHDVVLAGVLLRAPVTVRGTGPEFIPPSYQDMHRSWCTELETLRLGRANMKENHDALGVPENHITSAEAYPLWGNLTDLPKTYIQLCEVDILRDDGVCYAHGLEKAGVEVRKSFYKDLPHIFWVYGPGLEVSKNAQVDAVKGLRWLLEREA